VILGDCAASSGIETLTGIVIVSGCCGLNVCSSAGRLVGGRRVGDGRRLGREAFPQFGFFLPRWWGLPPGRGGNSGGGPSSVGVGARFRPKSFQGCGHEIFGVVVFGGGSDSLVADDA
jgi:hypothetical protein